ncbi:uncharacterized protein PITG_09831 [Phytophthora infestans T30-4]|uniref:Secreted RxLR effector peptide protein n=2 Tax=Phytophthora infestans TaxID=4787 RepID=D0NEN9_PHYIT|nr:uncharacterized protein PITG_09831 [Phytophthora infestans T30-4]EEY56321.1 conserved hypothetical protein [Phytophthora infestans T30-4]KAF4040965.1 hypothetical protein GN244_ATG07009 [Phytophthora infestans]KAF4143423.1 hypothetical protein GN958_ATG07382 [Phytophthora infestans]KAI9993140.1 hypothetical protein PInf_015207 [Phytophthora infestans]|eukprot:XP_002902395.1 conserved hypothetical protein [Phytophthora infestans T30-4]
MQLVKTLFVAAALCVAMVNAGNAHQQEQEQEQEEQNGHQYGVDSDSDSKSGSSTPSPVQKGFDVHQVKFTTGDPEEEKGEESSTDYTLLYVSLGACACIGVLGAVYMKRRKEDDKLPGEIFTIDDKNSVL